MKSSKSWIPAAAGLLALAMTLTACDSSADSTSEDTAGNVTTIEWWGWMPGNQESADLWNAEHKDVQIKYSAVSPGVKGGYDKMLTAVKAGNAPCLGQVGYETFTSFIAAAALTDITSYVTSAKDEFPDWTWAQVGIEGKTFGVPVDTGPMGMFYRTDVFEQYNIEIPTTWDEYRAAGEALKAANPDLRIGNLGNDAYNYSGFSWQAGASWFGTKGDAWVVDLDSEKNKSVADYWQGLVDDDLVATHPAWDAALYSAWAEGTVVTEVGAVWTAALIKDNAADSHGKWGVAPMPSWEGSDAVGNVGGGSNAVLAGCENAEKAAEVALWLSTNEASIGNLIDQAAIYPAASKALSNESLKEKDAFFGDEAIFDVFAVESEKVNTDWQWGPVMPVTSTEIGDGLGKVGSKGGTVAEAMTSAQRLTVEEIKSQGYTLVE